MLPEVEAVLPLSSFHIFQAGYSPLLQASSKDSSYFLFFTPVINRKGSVIYLVCAKWEQGLSGLFPQPRNMRQVGWSGGFPGTPVC